MMVRLSDTCTVGLPPDIDQAWTLLDIAAKYAGPLALAGQVLRGVIMRYTGRA